VTKAKQVEYLIKSLPEPEAEEVQVNAIAFLHMSSSLTVRVQAKRLQVLEDEMALANAEYAQAVDRASALYFFSILSCLSKLHSTQPFISLAYQRTCTSKYRRRSQ
jgi:hypothetical protein